MKKYSIIVLIVIEAAMVLGCYTNYKTIINNEIDGYFIVRVSQNSRDDVSGELIDIHNLLKVFSIETGEVLYYDLDNALGLHKIINAPAGVNNGEKISQMYFTPDRKCIAFRVYGTDRLGITLSKDIYKIIKLNLQTGETETFLFPEYCEPISMPDEKTWLYIDYSLERSEGKIFYKLGDMVSGTSRTIYTISDITAPKNPPHNFIAFYDLEYKALVFHNYYLLNDDNAYIYFEDDEKLEMSKYTPYWKMSMYGSNVMMGTKEKNWYCFNLGTREYDKIPFRASVIYPISENLYYFRDFMKPFGKSPRSMDYFRLGLYDTERNQVAARWFDNRTSYDPHVTEYVPQINISEKYRFNP
jgi:hypothetical protein